MIRQIIKIDESLCNGCGLCADACHEGAITVVNGKAKLIRDDYCDGLGDCLPSCPTGAISFEQREALEYNEEAVKENQLKKLAESLEPKGMGGGCPGSRMRSMTRSASPAAVSGGVNESRLSQWPVQIKLLPVSAPYFDGADVLIAADCAAYAYGSFHKDFIDGRITLIGCPKLDSVDYSEKLTAIFTANAIKSVTVTRMEVPCCGGIEHAVKTAVRNSGKDIALNVVTISADGRIL